MGSWLGKRTKEHESISHHLSGSADTEKFQRSVEENKHDNGLKQEWATLRINVACTAFKPRGENSIYPIKVRNWNDSQKNFSFKKNKKDTWMVSSAKL